MILGFFIVAFLPGVLKISDDQNNLRLRISANLEGKGKTSIKDFNKIRCSTTYAETKMMKDTIRMLVVLSKVAIKLAGDQPYIA